MVIGILDIPVFPFSFPHSTIQDEKVFRQANKIVSDGSIPNSRVPTSYRNQPKPHPVFYQVSDQEQQVLQTGQSNLWQFCIRAEQAQSTLNLQVSQDILHKSIKH